MIRVLIAALLLIGAAPAPPKPAAQTGSSAQVGAWNMATNELKVNLASGAFTAPGHVSMTRADGSTVDADRATGNYKKKQATLVGHVQVHDASGTFGLQSARNDRRGPATLTGDRLDIDDTTHLYDAQGHVHYTQGDTVADAERAHLDDSTHELQLSGHVHAVQGDRTLDAQTATYNTVTGHGEAEGNVSMTFPGAPISIATPKPIVIKKPKIP